MVLNGRPLFLFWQFNGDNLNYCNYRCPYCYGQKKAMQNLWKPELPWEEMFKKLKRDIYFVLSYGESTVSPGFFEVLDIIGKHENWECCLITNLSQDPTKMLNSKLAREGRLYITACYHPLGGAEFNKFTSHLLKVKKAQVKLITMFLLYPLQKRLYPALWGFCEENNIRCYLRRFNWTSGGRKYPESYSLEERKLLESYYIPKVVKYGLNFTSPKNMKCSAGKDMILVHENGDVGYCADDANNIFGNLFNENFKLNSEDTICQSSCCGGDYGMLHLKDPDYPMPQMGHDNFVCLVDNIKEGNPPFYPKRVEIEKWLKLVF